MLVADLYSLLPAFTLACLLAILLWPVNIAYKSRLIFFMIVLMIWTVASLLGMAGYGTTENSSICFVNVVVGFLGFVAVLVAYLTRPSRH